MRQLVPAAEQLSPTLIAFAKLAPEAKGFFEGLGPVIDNAPTGFPALRKLFRDDFPPLLRAVDPFLRNLNPILTGLDLYKHEVTSLFANVAAATKRNCRSKTPPANSSTTCARWARSTPESLSTYPNRLTTNRNSAYSPPLWAKGLATGLPSFDTRQCSAGITATLDPNTPERPGLQRTNRRGDAKEAEDFFDRLEEIRLRRTVRHQRVPAPGCIQQAPFNPIYGSGPPRPTSTRSKTANP